MKGEPTSVCYYCATCKGPMGPKDKVIPAVVTDNFGSTVRHADGFICGFIAEFYADHDKLWLADEHITLESPIEPPRPVPFWIRTLSRP